MVQGDGKGIYKKSNDDWVARILEIRVSDEHHVYARVYWMQRPEELLAGMSDDKKTVQGCPPYYAANEVLASDYVMFQKAYRCRGRSLVLP
ncbi:Bromo adjacent homology (BAH) domain superfamily [Fusarium oxysporum f. sp. vasinfectum]|nr:Bromo adjacent homology (BAH) domain superfamily [Fusarium oxysporum f. sp. vasinfectum]